MSGLWWLTLWPAAAVVLGFVAGGLLRRAGVADEAAPCGSESVTEPAPRVDDVA